MRADGASHKQLSWEQRYQNKPWKGRRTQDRGRNKEKGPNRGPQRGPNKGPQKRPQKGPRKAGKKHTRGARR